MKQILRINLGWSFLMLVWFAYLALGRYNHLRGVMLALAAAYAFIAVFALRQRRWAVALSIGVAAILTIRWLPMLLVNAWLFITRHELYLDSPATILIVAGYALVFAIPATLLCILYFVKRRELLLLFRNASNG